MTESGMPKALSASKNPLPSVFSTNARARAAKSGTSEMPMAMVVPLAVKPANIAISVAISRYGIAATESIRRMRTESTKPP